MEVKYQHKRSLAKGISWRIIGTLDTIILAFIMTGRIDDSLKIGGIEVVTKIILFYLHERLWLSIAWGIKYNTINHIRSLVKSFSWRITGSVDTIIISFFVTGEIALSLKIGSAEFITKIFLYYLHERAWNKVTWGKVLKDK